MASHLHISEASGFGLAAVMARKGATAGAIGERLGLALAPTQGWSGDATLALIGTGPGAWLACREAPDPLWAENLATRLAGLASVTDVSGGYRLFRLAGNDAARLLARGAFVDFHAPGCGQGAFGPGSVAVTAIAHIGVIIRQIDEEPSYEIAVFRSLGENFRHWLTTTAATL